MSMIGQLLTYVIHEELCGHICPCNGFRHNIEDTLINKYD